MSNSKLQIPEDTQRYLDFLRYSIDDACPLPDSIYQMDWYGLYDFAVEQAILGVIYHGIKRLPPDAPRPDSDLEITWFGMSEAIRKRNFQLNLVATKLTQNLAKAGFRSCILKGQGNALMYPDPYMRQPGDIDVWVDGSRDEVYLFVKQKVDKPSERYHHVDYPVVEGIPIELHHMPIFLFNPWANKYLQSFFADNKVRQFSNSITLPDNAGEFSRPTDDFNLVYQMIHTNHHFINQGVGLRHFLDYYFLLKRGCDEQKKKQLAEIFRKLNLTGFASSMMYVLQDLFGLSEEFLLLPTDKKKGLFLANELLNAGNLGQSDKTYGVKGKSTLSRFYLKTLRVVHIARVNPSEALFIHATSLFHQIKVAHYTRR